MRRREFITLLGSAATAVWPVRAWGQGQRRIGVLMGIAESDPEAHARIGALRQGLNEVGLREGQNVLVDYRWTSGDIERIRAYAAELVGLTPDAILATNTATVRALQQVTQTVPIVFVSVSDPIGDGFVTSLSEPSGNVTGFSSYDLAMAGKWLQLLKEVAPDLKRVAIVSNPAIDPHKLYMPSIEAAASTLSMQLVGASFRNNADIENVINEFSREPRGGLLTLPGSSTVVARAAIIKLADQHRIPAVYPLRLFVSSGGLLSYGTDTVDQYRKSASYIARILKGARATDLPVQQPTKFQLVINLRTAKSLRLTIPLAMQASADEIIE
jgi:putative ABC transport system substrate-binding protein